MNDRVVSNTRQQSGAAGSKELRDRMLAVGYNEADQSRSSSSISLIVERLSNDSVADTGHYESCIEARYTSRLRALGTELQQVMVERNNKVVEALHHDVMAEQNAMNFQLQQQTSLQHQKTCSGRARN